ncbi:AraC family transcriptional regulator [Nocardiopsis ansamitocini]|uniref:AraC family transcriptional regulator n=1 Tax=Nocardiopsis ansamitocini TaxID=1670832 RepID=A0A9W6P822_9ACTN|nr:AraC family transcriptional regulator [Nocardiopsis ansamitocini]
MASEVFVSPYHFSRIFSRATGVTPGQYLASVRLFEAKRLLLTTSLTVSDIVCSVGYNSVGTFTSRFTKAVGMSPTQYRHPEVSKLLIAAAPGFQHLPSFDLVCEMKKQRGTAQPAGGSIVGRLDLPAGAADANALVGVFADPIPQCAPVACQALTVPGTAELDLDGVPAGRWTAIAVAEYTSTESSKRKILVGASRLPITITPGRAAFVNLRMREPLPTDPPIAITLASRVSLQSQNARSFHTGFAA